MTSHVYSRSREVSEAGLRFQSLLARYPNVSEQELAEMINLFGDLPILDFGLMTADDGLSEKLSDFRRDQGEKLKLPISGLLLFLTFPAIVILTVAWWLLP